MLSETSLEYFYKIAKFKSFSAAAQEIGVSQPALSKSIKDLEYQMSAPVFIRTSVGIELTEVGTRLLHYVHSKKALEEELLVDVGNKSQDKLSGFVRIGMHSSIAHHIFLPAIAPVLEVNPLLQFELIVREVTEVADLLFSSMADLAITDAAMEKPGLEDIPLGFETFVLIKSKRKHSRKDVFLDVNPNDQITHSFVKKAGKLAPTRILRSFVHDDPGIVAGVKLGLGSGVVPMQSIQNEKDIVIDHRYPPMKVPVFLHYRKQSVYTRSVEAIKSQILIEIPKRLKAFQP